MKQNHYRHTVLAFALCALAGTAVAQSSPSTGATGSSTPGATNSGSTTPGMNSGTTSPGMNSGTTGSGAMNSGAMSPTSRMPSRTDSPDMAYKSLDSSNRGYLSKSDVQGLSGFNFDQADTNHDGRISKEEFAKAWGTTK